MYVERPFINFVSYIKVMYKLCYCAVVTVFTCSELLNLLSGAIFHRPPTDLAYSEYLLYTCKRERERLGDEKPVSLLKSVRRESAFLFTVHAHKGK